MDAITLHIQPDLTYTLEGDQVALDAWLQEKEITELMLINMMRRVIQDVKTQNVPNDTLLKSGSIITITSYGGSCIIREPNTTIYGMIG